MTHPLTAVAGKGESGSLFAAGTQLFRGLCLWRRSTTTYCGKSLHLPSPAGGRHLHVGSVRSEWLHDAPSPLFQMFKTFIPSFPTVKAVKLMHAFFLHCILHSYRPHVAPWPKNEFSWLSISDISGACFLYELFQRVPR